MLDNAFELIFAFDEIVALGYRENVNLAQIRTFTEMDSHEEKVFEAMRRVSLSHLSLSPVSSLCHSLFLFQSQEKEALDEMKRRAKELQLAKREARKEGRMHYTGGFGGGFGSHGARNMAPTVESLPPQDYSSKPSYSAPR